MTDQEWNIRAAKALNMEFCQSSDGLQVVIRREFAIALGLCTWTTTISVKDIKFTTSYDWAMLGVKKYMAVYEDNIHMHLFNLESKIIDVMGPDLDEEDKSERWGILRWSASPAQITQAWVELLEAENER